MGSISHYVDTESLWDARALGSDTQIPETELLKGIPEQYQSMILQESEKFSDTAALVLRDQLLQDLENNSITDNMAWYAQFGYGALVIATDPLTFAAAGPAAKTGQTVITTNRAWQISRVIGGKSIIKGSPTAAKLTCVGIRRCRRGFDIQRAQFIW